LRALTCDPCGWGEGSLRRGQSGSTTMLAVGLLNAGTQWGFIR
jgi:hypothetical protein